jgi:hypothetical protein
VQAVTITHGLAIMRGGSVALKGRAARTGKPASALDRARRHHAECCDAVMEK